MAVLRTASGLDRHDPLDLDLGSAPPHTHLMRELERIGHSLVGKSQHGQQLLLAEPDAALQHLFAGHVEDVVGHAYTSGCRERPWRDGASSWRIASEAPSPAAKPNRTSCPRPGRAAVAIAGALGPAVWAGFSRTTTALRAE